VTDVSRLLRGTPPFLAALAVATTFALPAAAAQPARAVQPMGAAQPARAAQWWLPALHIPQAWRDVPGAGKGVTVAVLSTGVDAAHQDLSGAVITGPDYSASGRTAGGPFWGAEGTAVASLIAGHGHGPGGAIGITGVAPGARILSLRVTLEYDDPLNADTAVTRRLPAAIAAGIRYAVGHGARVIALPLDPGTLGPAASGDPAAAGGSPAERAAVSYALSHDVVLVAPAGDNGAGTGTVNYPAAYPGVIAVGATTRNGQLAPFTSVRSYVALTAPGSGLTVAAPGGGYASLASTDMASALTAGVAALIRSGFPRLTAAEVAQALERGAVRPRTRAVPGTGRGALDATGALAAAAAIAAARPVPARTAPPSRTAPAGGPGAAHPAPARPAAARRADMGTLAGSLLRDAVIAAGALIAALAVALSLTRARRRRALPGRVPRQPGTRQGGSHARRHDRGAAAARPRSGRLDQAGLPSAGNGGPRVIPMRVAGTLTAARRARDGKAGGGPPWEPASPPEAEGPAARRAIPLPGTRPALPAAGSQPRTSPDGQVPPWEQAPEAFAAAPIHVDLPDRPLSNTGPMYVWNPARADPRPAAGGDAPEEGEGQELSERGLDTAVGEARAAR
jgi:subtilisin family serine protease